MRGDEVAWLKERSTRFNRWREVAHQQCVAGMVFLAECLVVGVGTSPKPREAMEWYHRAAEVGNVFAINAIGWMYHNGEGINVDYQKAMSWYQKAANHGQPLGMYNVGFFYENGYVGPKDKAEAIVWYQKSLDAGYLPARDELQRLQRK